MGVEPFLENAGAQGAFRVHKRDAQGKASQGSSSAVIIFPNPPRGAWRRGVWPRTE